MRTSVPERLSLVSNGFYMNKWLRKQLKQPCVKWKINTRKMNVFLVTYLGASEVLKLCFILWKENILSKLQKGSLEEISSISVQLKKNYVVVTSMPGFDTGRSLYGAELLPRLPLIPNQVHSWGSISRSDNIQRNFLNHHSKWSQIIANWLSVIISTWWQNIYEQYYLKQGQVVFGF